MNGQTNMKELRHDRHTISLLTDHIVFAPKYRGKILKGRTSRILQKEFPHLKEWCSEHMWAPSCYHGSVGSGWDVVSKYIETQDVHHAKNASYRPRT